MLHPGTTGDRNGMNEV